MMTKEEDLAYWRKRAVMTNEELLAEWCEQQRFEARGQIAGLVKSIADEQMVLDEVRRAGGNEEG